MASTIIKPPKPRPRNVLATSKSSPEGYQAQFLLGQALAGQGRPQDAAIAYDDAYNRSRTGSNAPASLLGLANSLTAIHQSAAACDTLASLNRPVPDPAGRSSPEHPRRQPPGALQLTQAAPATCTDRFAAAMARLGPFGPAPRLGLGVSGGADSMALAVLAQRWAAANGATMLALIVDHGLRAAAAAEAALTANRLNALGIPSLVLTLSIGTGPAVQARARSAPAPGAGGSGARRRLPASAARPPQSRPGRNRDDAGCARRRR